jgi:adenylate cyclase
VLPFTNMSGDSQQEYFSDGITNDLITDLARGPNIFVIDRASSFSYKGKPVKVQDVSRELGVKYLLEGGVQKTDDQVRISVQLVDATTGAELWAERYNRSLRDIFSLQDEIVRRIVTTLNLKLTLWERYGVLVSKTTDNVEAYDDFLRGVEYSQTFTKNDNEKARQMFQKAVELDPKYADAYGRLGYTYWGDWVFQWNHDPHALDRAFQLEQRAIALDDSVSDAHARLGEIYLFKRDYEQATAEAKRAVALNPNSAFGCLTLALIMGSTGKPAEVLALAEKAMRLDPRHRDSYLLEEGWAYRMMGRYEEAIPRFKQFLASYPNGLYGHLHLIVSYVELGREDEARAEAAEVLRISPKFSLDSAKLLNPQKDQTVANRFYADLRRAGLK